MLKPKLCISIVLEDDIVKLKAEIEKEIMEKAMLFPSFTIIGMQSGYSNDDFINNKTRIILALNQLNLN